METSQPSFMSSDLTFSGDGSAFRVTTFIIGSRTGSTPMTLAPATSWSVRAIHRLTILVKPSLPRWVITAQVAAADPPLLVPVKAVGLLFVR